MKLDSNQLKRLRDALYACHYMQEQDARRQVKKDLQRDYPDIRFESKANDYLDICAIIDSCLDHGGPECFTRFLDILEGFEGAEAETMKAVGAAWKDIIAPPIPAQLKPGSFTDGPPPAPKGGDPRRPNDVSQIGREHHWDSEHVVGRFVDVISGAGQRDIRVLAIPAPAETDPERLMTRLEAICDEVSRTGASPLPIIRATVQLRDMPKHQIVTESLVMLASKAGGCAGPLDDLRDQVETEWQQSFMSAPPSPSMLAQRFSECLAGLARKCRVVLLLPGFHNLKKDVSDWVTISWLKRHAASLEGVVVVLAGASKFEGFSQPPNIVCLDPIRVLTEEELWQWAYYGHELHDVTRAKVKQVNDCYVHGSPVRFYGCIVAWQTEQRVETSNGE